MTHLRVRISKFNQFKTNPSFTSMLFGKMSFPFYSSYSGILLATQKVKATVREHVSNEADLELNLQNF